MCPRMVKTILLLVTVLHLTLARPDGSPGDDHPLLRNKRETTKNVKCIPGPFYRNPEKGNKDRLDCSRYYLCIGGEIVYEYKCTTGLQFDITRQTCDFKAMVHNCDDAEMVTTPKPLLGTLDPICPEKDQLACGDGECMHRELFCDGEVDCKDGSDEGHCDIKNDPNAATKCDPKTCKLPNCYCSNDGTKIPRDMDPEAVPQIILLTFDDAVNFQNWNIYKEIFNNSRTNPNGCPIRGTFFLSHEYTNYQYAQKLWNDGHEIAVHSITHRTPETWWSKNASLEDWFDEFAGQANIINRFGNIKMEDLRGVRVPFLRVGWNKQFLMMKDFGFVYDSTMVPPFSDPPLWPYTLDHRMPHKCVGASNNCPSQSFPGIWELPMNQLQLNEEGLSCAMVDSCNIPEEEVFDFFMNNFYRHYEQNRAPLGLYFHTTWFQKYENKDGFLKFLNEMNKHDDVWIITNNQLVEWMKNPTSLNNVDNFSPWSCNNKKFSGKEKVCEEPNVCRLSSKDTFGEHYFHTCSSCPSHYPWIRNEFGLDDPSTLVQNPEEFNPDVQKKKK